MAFTTEFILGAGAKLTRVPVNVKFTNYDFRDLTTVTIQKRSILAGYVEVTGGELLVGPVRGPAAIFADVNTLGATLNAGTYTISATPSSTPGMTATAVHWMAIPL